MVRYITILHMPLEMTGCNTPIFNQPKSLTRIASLMSACTSILRQTHSFSAHSMQDHASVSVNKYVHITPTLCATHRSVTLPSIVIKWSADNPYHSTLTTKCPSCLYACCRNSMRSSSIRPRSRKTRFRRLRGRTSLEDKVVSVSSRRRI